MKGLIHADVLLDAMCVADVISNFFIGFIAINSFTSKAELISEWPIIARRYLRRWCVVEVLSIGIPFQVSVSWFSQIRLLVA